MFATVSAYTVLILISLTAILLFFIITHLISIAKLHQNDPMIPPKMKRKKVFLLSLTIIGVICFECSIILMAVLLLQLILIDSRALHLSKYQQLDYLIFIFDAMGHIVILYAFSTRFEYCFQGTLSNYNRRFILILRCLLLIMVFFSFGVVALMLLKSASTVFIFALDMTAEIALQIVALSLFYLFIIHSYHLITMSFPKSTQFRDFVRHLHEKYELREIESLPAPNMPSLAITIDGMPATAVKAVRKAQTSHEDELKVPIARWSAPGHSDPVDLVHVMNRKMLLAAMVIVCIIFNVFVITFLQLQRYDKLRDAQAIWVFMLIVFDMLVTALSMYLQFTFNHRVYWKLCSKVDLVLVKFALKLLKCCWVREHKPEHQQKHHRQQSQQQHGQIPMEEAMRREIDNYQVVDIQVRGGRPFHE